MKRILAILMALCAFAFLSAADKKKTEIVIGAAASLTDAMGELIGLYQAANPSITVTPTYSASGTLQKQIEQGAPVDVFFSAATKQMDALDAKGLLLAGTRKDMLVNALVLVTPASGKKLASFADAATAAVKQIALGEPASVPAGQYAADAFTSLGVYDVVKAKAVYAKDVRQVLSYVASGEVDAGVVYSTDAITTKNVVICAEAPKGSVKPIIYPAAVVSVSQHPDEAKAFLAWLGGPEASTVFVKYGFAIAK
jgi:molybdate transport system substrate-binding protein